MNKSLLVAALLAVALTACGKKEEAAATLPQPAVAPALPSAAPTPNEAPKPAESGATAAPVATSPAPAAGENTGSR